MAYLAKLLTSHIELLLRPNSGKQTFEKDIMPLGLLKRAASAGASSVINSGLAIRARAVHSITAMAVASHSRSTPHQFAASSSHSSIFHPPQPPAISRTLSHNLSLSSHQSSLAPSPISASSSPSSSQARASENFSSAAQAATTLSNWHQGFKKHRFWRTSSEYANAYAVFLQEILASFDSPIHHGANADYELMKPDGIDRFHHTVGVMQKGNGGKFIPICLRVDNDTSASKKIIDGQKLLVGEIWNTGIKDRVYSYGNKPLDEICRHSSAGGFVVFTPKNISGNYKKFTYSNENQHAIFWKPGDPEFKGIGIDIVYGAIDGQPYSKEYNPDLFKFIVKEGMIRQIQNDIETVSRRESISEEVKEIFKNLRKQL